MKKAGLILTALVLSIFLIGVVSAQLSGGAGSIFQMLQSAIDELISLLQHFMGPLFNETDTTSTSVTFMSKVLFFIILMSLIYVTLSSSMRTFFAGNKWALWLISIVIPIIGLRLLDSGWIYTMILPTSSFTVAVVCAIPFVLTFFMTKNWLSGTARRIAWGLFGVVFFVMYILNAGKPGAAGVMVYALTGIMAIVMIILDGTFKRLRDRMAAEKVLTSRQYEQYVRKVARRNQLEQKLSESNLPPTDPAYVAIRNEINTIDAEILAINPNL